VTEAEAAAEADNKPLMQYPSTGADYAEIDDDDIVSPYIALLDVDNSKVIAGKESEERIYPASMTKVMTLVVAVENIKDMSMTYALSSAQIDPLVRAEASRAGFDPNEEVSVTDYLYGLILPSGADAAVALCNIAAGSEEAFVELMNKKCSELGLKNTHFTNSSGLYDEEQYTTPTEMAVIMAYAMTNETCAKVLSTYKYTTTATEKHPEGIALTSTMFGRMYGTEVENVTITAGKTGYTIEAGNCLVSYAEKNGHRYVALTAGASNKWDVIYDDFRIYDRYLP
jgi:D-alanyl-D-alanine carboxypeptidase (penicillin-binding protein 5/6)